MKQAETRSTHPHFDAHVVADQSEIFALLAKPSTYAAAPSVKRIDTHGAVVFLAGSDAFKVKRAVRFPFMDFSTLEKRRVACERELEVNWKNAPDIYLGTVPIVRSGDALALGGEGEAIEWTVHMRRFDENATLDKVAERHGLSDALVSDLARTVLRSHERAPRKDFDGGAALKRYVIENAQSFSESPELFPAERVTRLSEASRASLLRNEDLLVARRKAGFMRRCHGDLHLRNIVLSNDGPILFDALEFDEAMATGDILYDLAFLIMDLWERGLAEAANGVLNRYLWGSDDAQLAGLALLPVFISIRAAIRAKVVAASIPYLAEAERGKAAREALRYFALAEDCLADPPARLVAIGGLSGTGKTLIARKLAPLLGRIPGGVHLRSDIERKRLFAAAETERLSQSRYTPEATAEVYARVGQKARMVLGTGYCVVADAVHALAEERGGIKQAAHGAGVAFDGLWLEASLQLRIERVEARKGDASDATADYVRRQAGGNVGTVAWRHLEASGDPASVLAEAVAALGLDLTVTGKRQDPDGPAR